MVPDCVNNDDNCCFAVYPSDRTLVKSKRSEVHTFLLSCSNVF